MKNSGIEWIGEIPDDWNLIKIGSIFQCRNEKVNDTDYPPLSVSKGGVVPQMDSVAKTDANDNRKLVLQNDFVINSRSDRKQSCGYSTLNGSVSLINTVLYTTNNKIILPQYTDYLMKNCGFAEEFYRWGHGIVADLWTTRWQEMKNIVLPIPSIDIQQKVAVYLDKKCAAIDSMVVNQQAQIEKLKEYKQSVITEAVTKGLNPSSPFKDSGVEWLGKIPAGWKIIRGKNILTLLNKPVLPTDNVITCFRDGEVTLRSNRREEGFTFSEKEIGYQGIDVGDLVVHGMDGFAGAIGISDSRGKASPVLIVLNSKQNKQYLMFYLRSLAYRDIFLALSTGIRVRSCDLRWNKLSALPFLIPSLKEQDEIVSYIDDKLQKIDKLISIKQQKIETLTEYKKSLIYEYVTGKKQVG